jgi:glycosyltransferase A (GT-A) superfamily protein (DUF2064 family)
MSLLVALFAREPVAGQTKTRLIPALGAEGACALYEAFLDDVAATTQQLRALHPDVELALYSAEAQPGPQLRERAERWAAAHRWLPQQGETLGDRMSHALSWASPLRARHWCWAPTPDTAAHPPHCP